MVIKKKMLFAREVRNLFDEVNADYHRLHPDAGRVTNSVLFAFAWDWVRKLPAYRSINWAGLARLQLFSPEDVTTPGIRYGSSLSLPVSLYPSLDYHQLELFRQSMALEFAGIRRCVYLPYCVRLLLRVYLIFGIRLPSSLSNMEKKDLDKFVAELCPNHTDEERLKLFEYIAQHCSEEDRPKLLEYIAQPCSEEEEAQLLDASFVGTCKEEGACVPWACR